MFSTSTIMSMLVTVNSLLTLAAIKVMQHPTIFRLIVILFDSIIILLIFPDPTAITSSRTYIGQLHFQTYQAQLYYLYFFCRFMTFHLRPYPITSHFQALTLSYFIRLARILALGFTTIQLNLANFSFHHRRFCLYFIRQYSGILIPILFPFFSHQYLLTKYFLPPLSLLFDLIIFITANFIYDLRHCLLARLTSYAISLRLIVAYDHRSSLFHSSQIFSPGLIFCYGFSFSFFLFFYLFILRSSPRLYKN